MIIRMKIQACIAPFFLQQLDTLFLEQFLIPGLQNKQKATIIKFHSIIVIKTSSQINLKNNFTCGSQFWTLAF